MVLRVNGAYTFWRGSQSRCFEEFLPSQGQSHKDVLLSPKCSQGLETRGHPPWCDTHGHWQWQGKVFLIWFVLREKDNRNTWSILPLACTFSFLCCMSWVIEWSVLTAKSQGGLWWSCKGKEGLPIAFLPCNIILLACRETWHWLPSSHTQLPIYT